MAQLFPLVPSLIRSFVPEFDYSVLAYGLVFVTLTLLLFLLPPTTSADQNPHSLSKCPINATINPYIFLALYSSTLLAATNY